MNIRTFELERVQSLYENDVEFNLTESGFHPLTLNEFLSREQIAELTNISLGYGRTNGSIPLRKGIAKLYSHQDEMNVLLTNGSAEANFVACHTLLEKGDEVVMMVPNYMQIWGIAEEMGCVPKAFHLKEEKQWAPDLEELKQLVNPKTKMIALCNPNNPTGYTLTTEEIDQIVKIAAEHDTWIYADEIYKGAELDGQEIPGFVGKYDKVMVNGGLSKAYALPGLRIGWLLGPKDTIENAWSYHDYTSITTGALNEKISEFILNTEGLREKILIRNRQMLKENVAITQEWVESLGKGFYFIPPQSGGVAYISYDLDINSTEMSEWLMAETSVFILAGDCFGMDGYFRLGIGAEKEALITGLKRIKDALDKKGIKSRIS